MTPDQIKAAAEKYAKVKCGYSAILDERDEVVEKHFLAGAELMRAEITELERKLAIAVGALERLKRFNPSYTYTFETARTISIEALAKIQAIENGEGE